MGTIEAGPVAVHTAQRSELGASGQALGRGAQPEDTGQPSTRELSGFRCRPLAAPGTNLEGQLPDLATALSSPGAGLIAGKVSHQAVMAN